MVRATRFGGTYSIDLKGAGLDGGNVNVAFAVRGLTGCNVGRLVGE